MITVSLSTLEPLNVPEVDLEKPEKIQEERHWITSNHCMQCDVCNQAICGLRIECINCPAFNMCLSCSLKRSHNEQHICEVVRGQLAPPTDNVELGDNETYDFDFDDDDDDEYK